jgi:hypothetical protein
MGKGGNTPYLGGKKNKVKFLKIKLNSSRKGKVARHWSLVAGEMGKESQKEEGSRKV